MTSFSTPSSSTVREWPGSLRSVDRKRLRELVSGAGNDTDTVVEALLQFGTEQLDVQNGHLSRINVGLGTHTITATSGSPSLISEGKTSDLSTTYCRQVLVSESPCVVQNAPDDGWSGDPAYETFGFATYLGTKVLVDDQLYGTVCFVDTDARKQTFEEAEIAIAEAISRQLGHLLEPRSSCSSSEQFRQKFDLLQQVQRVAQIGGWELDLPTEELSMTDEAHRIFELPLTENPDLDSVLGFYSPPGRSRLRDALQRCREDGEPFDLELPITTAEGNRRWVRTQGEAQREDGEIARVVGTDQDVTEQYQLRDKLTLNQNKLRRLVRHSTPVVFVLDADGTFLLSEGEDLHSIGLSPGKVVGKSIFDLYEDHPELLGQIEEALSGTPVECEMTIDGTIFDSSYAPYYNGSGEVAGCIGVATNVTKHRTIRDELHRTRARVKALFEQSPDMIYVHDEEGNILDPNPRLCELTGYTEEELTDMKVWELDEGLPPDRARAQWEKMDAGDRRRLEGEYRRKDGSSFPVEVHLRHLDRDGENRFMAISRNISERKEEERRRKQIISRVTDAIVEVDENWRFTLVNEQAEALYEMAESDLLGERFWDVFSDARGTRLEREYRRVMQTRDPTGIVEYYAGLDGWFDIQVYPREEGGLAFYFEEVTQHKERERRLDAVFNHTYQFTGLLDPDGTVLEANDTALTFGDVKEEDVVGLPLWETPWAQTDDDTKQRLRDAINRAADGELVRYEGSIQGQNGERIVDFSIRPVTNEREEVTLLIPEARDITEQKEREAALREERNLLERVFQTSPTAIALLNADGQFIRVSDRAQDILGLEKNDVTDRTFNDPDWQITAPDGSVFPDEKLPFAQVKEKRESVFEVEHAIEWPDGTRRLLSVSGAPLHDPDGTFIGAVFHLSDITQQRKTQRRLVRSEKRFRGIFENAALGIGLVCEEGTLLEANPSFERMLGYKSGELQGMHFSTLTHPDDVEDDKHLFNELVAGSREQYQIEKRYVTKNGEVFWGRLTVSRQDGPEDLQIVGMIEDIDTEKRRKQQLRLFRKMVEHSNDAIVLSRNDVQAEGPEMVYVNPAFEELTGYEVEEAIGETDNLLHGPKTHSWVIEETYEKLTEGRPVEGETINYRKDGAPFVKQWSVAPIRNDEGEITHFVSIQRDITEQRRTQEQLLEVQEEERRRIDQKIHDEMGGLLTTLQMTIELARHEKDATDPDRLDDIETLVDELSSTARSISRRIYPNTLSEEGLCGGLPELVDKIKSHHDLEVDVDVHLDEEEQVSSLVERTVCWIVNEALSNVAQHAQTDEAKVLVDRSSSELLLKVSDEGVGFDLAAQSQENTLGLEGIRHRVERLNGTFKIETAPGEGACLRVVIPLSVSSVPR